MKKILLCVLGVCSFFILNSNVFASDIKAEAIDNVVKCPNMSTKANMYYYSFNDKPIYLINLKFDIGEDTDYTQYEEEQIYFLSDEKKENIGRIIKYGYGYKDHTEKKWYVATQYLIWKAVYPQYDIDIVDSTSGNIDSQYDEMIDEINDLLIQPVSDDMEINYNDSITIDNVDYTYDIDSFYEYSIKDNKYIASNIKSDYTITLNEGNDNRFNDSIKYLKFNTSDYLVYPGTYKNSFSKVVNVNIKKIDFKINFNIQNDYYSADSNYDDICYELYKDNLLIKEMCLKDGMSFDINGTPGEYYYVQSTNGSGYISDNVKHYLTIDSSKKYFIDVLQIHNKFTSKIIYCVDDICEAMPSIKFNLYDNKHNLIDILYSDNNGEVNYELGYGQYLLEQLNGYDNYDVSAPLLFEILNSEDNYYFNLKNNRLKVESNNEDDITLINKNNDTIINLEKINEGEFVVKDSDVIFDTTINTEEEGDLTDENDFISYENSNLYSNSTVENPDTSADKKSYKYLYLSFLFFALRIKAMARK